MNKIHKLFVEVFPRLIAYTVWLIIFMLAVCGVAGAMKLLLFILGG